MKPKKLEIEGLNSFIEKQEIDFDSLTERGLFGIFGPTGSGKSTILDAIILALYGEIPRDSKDFINTNCKGASVYYEFEIGVGTERKTYSVYRAINKDKNGSYKVKNCRLVEIDGGESTIIADSVRDIKHKITEIIGLTADDFTRCVVLPQGKFNEFLKLSGVERRNMLERIFALEKYGRTLGDKIKKSKRDSDDKRRELNGRCISYEERGITDERYKELQKSLKDLRKKEKSYKDEKAELDKRYESEKSLWDIQKQLIEYEKKYDEEIKKKDEIEQIRKRCDMAKKSEAVKPFIDSVKSTEKELSDVKTSLEQAKVSEKELEESVKKQMAAYNEAFELKEKEVPGLIDLESKLNAAKRTNDNKEKLEIERDKAKDEYKRILTNVRVCIKKIDILAKEFESKTNEKIEIDKKIKEYKVTPEYRASVQRGLAIERDIKKIKKDREELQKEIEDITLTLKAKNQEYAKKKNELEKCENDLKSLNDELQPIKKEKEKYTDEILIGYMNDKSGLENSIKKASDIQNKLKDLKKQLRDIVSEKMPVDENISELNLKKSQIENLLSKKKEELQNIKDKNMASILAAHLKEGDPCPVCGSVHHVHIDYDVKTGEIRSLEEEIENSEKVYKDLTDTLREIQIKNAGLESKIALIQNDIKGVMADEAEVSDLEELNEKLKNIKMNIEKFNSDRSSAEKKDKDLTERIESLSEIRNDLNRDTASISAEIKMNDSRLQKDKSKSIDMDKKIQSLENSLKDIDISMEYDSFYEEDEAIKAKDAEYDNLAKLSEDMESNIKEIENAKKSWDDKKIALEKENSKIEETGVQLKIRIESMEKEIEAAAGERQDIEQYIKETAFKKDSLIKDESDKRKCLEEKKDEYTRIKDKRLSLYERDKTLEKMKETNYEKLKESLKNNGFGCYDDALKSLMTKEEIADIEIRVKSFDDMIHELNVNIKSAKDKLQRKELDSEKWNDMIEKREKLSSLLEESARNMGGIEGEIDIVKKDLAALKEIKRQLKDLDHLCGNLDDLSKLIEGNKFVEFVAKRHLKYICIGASKWLKDISSGRYALEIDDSGSFIMRDDFNGGSRRATSSLSGGETFLTSLSLALALSSQIQLKGSAPLEFFFLDEGFGTLDSELLNTVMNSLDRLHSKRMSVGIISHVEELKSRVPIKLIVEGSTRDGRGSTVNIELS